MFLKELLHYNKKLFLCFVIFLAFFVFLNFKWGVVASPVHQFGMYSGRYTVKDTQEVYRIYVNEQLIDFTNLSLAQRDQLQFPLFYFERQKQNNLAVFTTMKRVLSKVLIGKLMKEEDYTNQVSSIAFTNWYSNKLQQMLGYPVTKLEVTAQKYIYQNNTLQPTAEPRKLPFIVIN